MHPMTGSTTNKTRNHRYRKLMGLCDPIPKESTTWFIKQPAPRITTMNTHKTSCLWCKNIYSTAAAYSNHILQKHPQHGKHSNKPLKRRTPDEPNDTTHFFKPPDDNLYYSTFAQIPSELSNHLESDQFGTRLKNILNHLPESDTTLHDDSTKYNSDIEPQPDPVPDNSPNATPYSADRTHRIDSRYQATQVISQLAFHQRSLNYNHSYPFLNPRDYMLARFFTCSEVNKTRINEFFRDNLSSALCSGNPTTGVGLSFRSGHTFYKQSAPTTDHPAWKTSIVQYALRPKSECSYRNILQCIQYLLRQRAFLNISSCSQSKYSIRTSRELIPKSTLPHGGVLKRYLPTSNPRRIVVQTAVG